MATRIKAAREPIPKPPKKEKKPKRYLKRSTKPINKLGKKGKADKANVKALKKIFDAKDLTYCLLQYEGCWREVHGFAHSLRRRFITEKEILLEAIPACNFCHRLLDLKSKDETEREVKRIRAEHGL